MKSQYIAGIAVMVVLITAFMPNLHMSQAQPPPLLTQKELEQFPITMWELGQKAHKDGTRLIDMPAWNRLQLQKLLTIRNARFQAWEAARLARQAALTLTPAAPVVVAGVAVTGIGTGVAATAGTAGVIGLGMAGAIATAIPFAVGGVACEIYRRGYNRAVARNQALCVSLHICRTTRHMVRNPQCSEADLLTAIQDNTAWLHYWGRALKTCIALTFGVVTPISLNTACP